MSSKPDVDRWLTFAETLSSLGERICAEGEIPMSERGAADPRVVAVLLLIRTMSHFRGVITMARTNLLVEARILARSCFENLFYVAALREKGWKFVLEMKRDELASRHARGEFIMGLSDRKKDEDLDAKLRNLLREWAKEERKFLNVKATALAGVTAQAYLYYSQLSADAGHPTLTSLDRYLITGKVPNGNIRGIDFNPVPEGDEMPQTISWACEAVLGVCIGVNEMLGHTPASPDLVRLAEQYASLEGVESRLTAPISLA